MTQCTHVVLNRLTFRRACRALTEAWQHQVPPLPFELQVLEVVLGDVVAMASQLARDLEAVVHPALDSLMKSVSLSVVSLHNWSKLLCITTAKQAGKHWLSASCEC